MYGSSYCHGQCCISYSGLVTAISSRSHIHFVGIADGVLNYMGKAMNSYWRSVSHSYGQPYAQLSRAMVLGIQYLFIIHSHEKRYNALQLQAIAWYNLFVVFAALLQSLWQRQSESEVWIVIFIEYLEGLHRSMHWYISTCSCILIESQTYLKQQSYAQLMTVVTACSSICNYIHTYNYSN